MDVNEFAFCGGAIDDGLNYLAVTIDWCGVTWRKFSSAD
jgi:hypothetical protein